MELTEGNKQALKYLKESQGWKLLCNELDERIADIEEALRTPGAFDKFGDEIKQLNAIKAKQFEIAYLIQLKELPDDLLSMEIMPIDK